MASQSDSFPSGPSLASASSSSRPDWGPAASDRMACSSLAGNVSEDDYRQQFWPRLRQAVQEMLELPSAGAKPNAALPRPVYHGLYMVVFKMVTSGMGEQLFDDVSNLLKDIFSQWDVQLDALYASPNDYVVYFGRVSGHYARVSTTLVSILSYLSQNYVQTRFNSSVKEETGQLFGRALLERQEKKLFDLLSRTTLSGQPAAFVDPAATNTLLKNLLSLAPHLANKYPAVFSLHPTAVQEPMVAHDLTDQIEYEKLLQKQLISSGFGRQAQGAVVQKRPLTNDDDDEAMA